MLSIFTSFISFQIRLLRSQKEWRPLVTPPTVTTSIWPTTKNPLNGSKVNNLPLRLFKHISFARQLAIWYRTNINITINLYEKQIKNGIDNTTFRIKREWCEVFSKGRRSSRVHSVTGRIELYSLRQTGYDTWGNFLKSNQPTIQQNDANIQCYIKSIPKPTVRIKPISQSYDLSIRSTLPRSFNTKSNQTNYFII